GVDLVETSAVSIGPRVKLGLGQHGRDEMFGCDVAAVVALSGKEARSAEALAFALFDVAEATKLALCPIEIAVTVAVGRGKTPIRHPVEGLDFGDDLHGKGQMGRPGPAF